MLLYLQWLSEIVLMSVILSILMWVVINFKMLFIMHVRFDIKIISIQMVDCVAILKRIGECRYDVKAICIGKKEVPMNDKIKLYYKGALIADWCHCSVVYVRKKVRVVLPICMDMLYDIEHSYIKCCHVAIALSIILEVLHVFI